MSVLPNRNKYSVAPLMFCVKFCLEVKDQVTSALPNIFKKTLSFLIKNECLSYILKIAFLRLFRTKFYEAPVEIIIELQTPLVTFSCLLVHL